MRVVREANTITSAQELAKQLGLDVKTDCLQYHCLGSCPGCSLEHKVNPAFKKDKAAELLEKAKKIIRKLLSSNRDLSPMHVNKL